MNNLTSREQDFICRFLAANCCGANNSEQLLNDNFSCQCVADLQSVFKDLTANQIGGFLSSLQEKSVIWMDERDGSICKSENRIKQINFEPNLYWVENSFLESNLELSF